MANNLHEKHRVRLRKRLIEEGLDSFEDHQVLELILFFAIPRRDTNELAHLLLRRYGSLSGVLETDPVDLERTNGVGTNAATLLALLPALTRRYGIDRAQHARQALLDSEQAARFLLPFMTGRTEETFYLVCLDTQCRSLRAATNQRTVGVGDGPVLRRGIRDSGRSEYRRP